MTRVAEIEKLLSDYRTWLKDKTTLRELNGVWVEITTPYLDRHNDALQIYARADNGGYVLTDDSYTIHDPRSVGLQPQHGKARDLLQMTLNGFGVKLNSDAIEVHATAENFPLRKHSLIQAMLAVNDLFYLAKPVVESLFLRMSSHGLRRMRSVTRQRRSSPAPAATITFSISSSRSRASSPNASCKPSLAHRARPLSRLYTRGPTPGRSGLPLPRLTPC